MKKLLLTATMSLCALAMQATANITGYWTTIDDETNEAKSVVQVYKHNGKVYGRVVELLQNPGAKAKIKGSPSVKGLTIIWDLEKDGDTYSGGEEFHKNEKLLEDVDGTQIQIYNTPDGKIKVFNDYEVGAVYVDSEIELKEIY